MKIAKKFIPVSSILFFLLFQFNPQLLVAQMFQTATGPVSNTVSDSRSVNFLDLNNDGWEDLYISNGLAAGQADLMYLNDGTGQIVQVTGQEVTTASNPSDGASFVDYNNDGHIEGMITSWHGAEDLLYLNNGNAELVYNEDAGIVPGSYAETAAFGDYDGDGWLDLYITNSGGDNKNYLYRNLQNGKFEQITNHVLVADAKLSRGAIWGDFNGDGMADLFVANESNAANDLFFGQGGGSFQKLNTGSIVNSPKGSMTGSWGDIDNDGDFDLFVGNSGYFSTQKNQLFRNTDSGFEEIIDDPAVMIDNCSYGSAFGDYDNDGDLDLMVANGYCNSGLSNVLYANQGDGTFADSSHLLSSNFIFCSFGVAWGDVNNDGFLDLMVANCKNNDSDTEKANALLMNQGNENNWLKIKLTGVQSNTSAIGAKVKIKATINGVDVWQVRELRSQSGYAAQNSLVVHFGLGEATQVDSLVLDWPAGGTQTLTQIDANQFLNLTEDISNSTAELSKINNVIFQVFPNPASTKDTSIQLSIKSKIQFQNARIIFYNGLGQAIWKESVNIDIGKNQLSIPLSGMLLSSGVCQVVLELGKDRIVENLFFATNK